MTQKTNDFSSAVLVSSIEESLREFWGNWGRAPQSDLYDGPHMMRLYTGVPYAFCNGVVSSQIAPDLIDDEIEKTMAYFSARNAIWEWIVGPNSMPVSLGERLIKHGLHVRGESIGMAIDLRAMGSTVPSLPKLQIIQVGDDETLKLWANTMAEGFESPALLPDFVELECSLGIRPQTYRHYLGILDQKPISTSGLFLGEKVAGVYCVSTLPEARRLGIGAITTLIAMHEARAMGYPVAVLQSSQMGRGIYRRIGFKEYSLLRFFSPVE